MHGYLALILTAHVPYLRTAGRQPEGEDLLHETIACALVPTLNALYDLRDLGVRPAVGLAYSPVLLEQLADRIVQKHFVLWMEQRFERIIQALARWERQGQTHASYLARFYLDWGQGILDSFEGRYNRNLVAAIRELCAEEGVEPLAGAATHAYLPLLGRSASLRAQLDIGTLGVTRHLGRPRGLWLPECGYHPSTGEHILAAGMRYFIVDPSSLGGAASLRPRWAVARRLALFARDTAISEQIWSAQRGYSGDPIYRSPRRDAESDLELWRAGFDQSPELYDPYDAFQHTREHASHFQAFVAAELAAFHAQHGRPAVAVVALDAALLGRRWFEGPAWLRATIEAFEGHPTVALITPSAYLRAHPPRQTAQVGEGSWGLGGHRAWDSRAAYPLWQAIHEAEERLVRLARRFPNAQDERERVLAQALRELLLAQSSDWPLLLGQGAAAAIEPPIRHLRRCSQLCAMAEAEALSEDDRAFLEQVEELDNIFPQLNYRVFADNEA